MQELLVPIFDQALNLDLELNCEDEALNILTILVNKLEKLTE